ncbi:MAG: hypothetical protein AB7K24_04155 [Gemmataceae bacterium]
MPIQNLLALTTNFAGIFGSDEATEIARKYFAGSWRTLFGHAGDHTYGSRAAHAYGIDNKLVVGGGAGGLLPFLGQYVNAFDYLLFGFLGPDNYVRTVYGQQIEIVYGGPRSRILRGPQIEKTTTRSLGLDYPSLIPSALTVVKEALKKLHGSEAAEALPQNQLALPDPTQGAVNPEAFAPLREVKHRSFEKLIFGLSQVLILLTAAVDLAVYFKYRDYNPAYDPNDPDRDIDALPGVLLGVTGFVTDILQGFIYQCELMSVYDDDLQNAQSESMTSLEKSIKLISYYATNAKAIIEYCIEEAKNQLAVVIKDVMVLQMLILLAVAGLA